MGLLTPSEASERIGEAVPAALAMETALVVDPTPLLELPRVHAEVATLERTGEVWRLLDRSGASFAEAGIVVIRRRHGKRTPRPQPAAAAGAAARASFARGLSLGGAVLFGGYAAPAPDGIVFGATHDRDDEDLEPRDADHDRNRAALAAVLPGLAASLEGRSLEARTGVRATTRDYLPLAGETDGLFVLTGLGSRGFSLAPLLADHVAALALGRPSPLPISLAALVDPARFAARRASRKAGLRIP